MDGQYSIEPYLNYTQGIGPNDLTDFTFCLRFNVNYLKPKFSTLLSYSTALSDNSFLVDLWMRSKTVILSLKKYPKHNQGRAFYKTHNQRKFHNEWHHACMSLKTEELESDKIKVSTKLYFDGHLQEEGM